MRKLDLNSEQEVKHLRDDIINKEGKINHVIVSVGGWRTDGKLSTVSVDTYEKAVRDMTLPHFVCYKTFSGYLSQQPKSSYMMITSGSGKALLFYLIII